MIQRVQSLLLLEIAFLSVSLLFVPVHMVTLGAETLSLSLVPSAHPLLSSTAGHLAAIAVNAAVMVLSFVTIFLYRKRELQVKLCYLIAGLLLVLLAMNALCPFTKPSEGAIVHKNIFGYIIPLVGFISALIAARFVKKDIDLLKSADRIR